MICSLWHSGNSGFFLKKTSFSALPGWETDDQKQALAAFRKSCAKIEKKKGEEAFGFAGTAADWKIVCAKIPQDIGASKTFFEENFIPYGIWGESGRTGLFTGYYEPLLNEAGKSGVPLYARPDDLVTVELGDFRPDLKGESIAGRVRSGKLIPYPSRAEIDKGALKNVPEIVRVDDPADAFFLHIQGSGQVKKTNGKILRVGYAAQNGHPYYAIGKELVKNGALKKEEVSLQSIRRWMDENPDKADELMRLNPSYVFFRVLPGDGALGAEGTVLTPGRSLAVDRRKIPYGTLVFIDTQAPEDEGPRLQRLMVAQDTGGAIRGAVRGDVFWGAGQEAEKNAGVMKSQGRAYILIPKNVRSTIEKWGAWNVALF